jgi:hypothetical protein
LFGDFLNATQLSHPTEVALNNYHDVKDFVSLHPNPPVADFFYIRNDKAVIATLDRLIGAGRQVA